VTGLALARIVAGIGQFYIILIIAYTLMSWFPMRGSLYDVYRVLGSVVEPYVSVFRRFIPLVGGLDFSPWAAILVVEFVIVPLLTYLALLLR
jgi:YggT family protein